MNSENYIISSDEMTRQIHRVLKDTYPSLSVSGDEVAQYISKEFDDVISLNFKAKEFSEKYNIAPADFIENIYIELQVEYEKNWHDRIYFRILRDENAIYFEGIKK